MSNSKGIFQEMLIVTILFVLICLIYKGQQRVSYNEGKGWDGVYYYEMSQQFQQGTFPVAGRLPFIKRIGVPFLVGYFSRITGITILDSALIINLIGFYIIVILSLLWMRIFIGDRWIRLLLLFLLMMAWYVHLRECFFNPQGTDNWGTVWFLAGLLALNRMRENYYRCNNFKIVDVLFFSIIVGVGIFFRETNSILALAPFFLLNPLSDLKISFITISSKNLAHLINRTWRLYFTKKILILALPILMILIANAIVSGLILVSDQFKYSYLTAACKTFYNKSLPEYMLGIFNAYGPIIVLLPFFWKHFKPILIERQELLFLLIVSFFMGYVGAGGTERITFMSGFPIMFLLIAVSIRGIFYSGQRWWLFVLLFLQTIAHRYYWGVPDFPNEISNTPIPFFTLPGTKFQFLYLYSGYGSFMVNTVLFLEYIVLCVISIYVLFNKVEFKWPILRNCLKNNG